MPKVVIRSGVKTSDGHEETLTEYLCDWPDCPNVAEHVLGMVRDIGQFAAVCNEHAVRSTGRSQK